MKTFIRTIIVLVVLNLAMGCFASAQNASEKADLEAAKKEMQAAQKEIEAAQRLAEAAERKPENVLRQLLATRTQIPGVGRSRSLTDRHDGSGQVLVIPATEIKVKDLVTIMEDMSVMARIFDKKLGKARMLTGGRFRGIIPTTVFFGDSGNVTEGIYLDGYGALFLMKVNFPLSPPPKVEKKEKIEEPADPIWEETKREIYAPEDVGWRRRAPAAKYDVEKVEDLKRKLIKALKHAANIRNLKPSESIIITVTGEGDQFSGTIIRLLIKRDTIDTDVEDRDVDIYGAPFSDEMVFSSPMVLTIRVKKSDVDAFAKGKLDFDKFRQKVQIFTY